MLTRDMIIEARDFEKEIVEVPEWNGSVCIRSMNVSDLIFMQKLYSEVHTNDGDKSVEENIEAMIELLSRCISDENGILLLNDSEGRDILKARDINVLQELMNVALRVNKLDDEAMDQEKKQLLQTASTGSGSNSV